MWEVMLGSGDLVKMCRKVVLFMENIVFRDFLRCCGETLVLLWSIFMVSGVQKGFSELMISGVYVWT